MSEDRADQEFDEALENYVQGYFVQARDVFDTASRQCQSPLEKLLFAHLFFISNGWGCSYVMPTRLAGDTDVVTEVIPQHPIGPYRADFAVVTRIAKWFLPTAPREIKIAVEVDGHDFHEKTKEQAARDKARDRYFAHEGWIVLRFTGSEVYRDPKACVGQIEDLVAKQIDIFIEAHTANMNAQEARP